MQDLGRFNSAMDTIDRLPQTGDKGIYLKQQLKDKLIEHKLLHRQMRRGPAGNPELEVELVICLVIQSDPNRAIGPAISNQW